MHRLTFPFRRTVDYYAGRSLLTVAGPCGICTRFPFHSLDQREPQGVFTLTHRSGPVNRELIPGVELLATCCRFIKRRVAPAPPANNALIRGRNGTMRHMQLTIRLLRETDGRWIGDIPELPGVTVYGATPEEATRKAKSLALRVIAEEIEHGEMSPAADMLQFSVAA